MILAAGQGKRMQPLTKNCPKPLLEAGNQTLIEHQINALARAGIQRLVINHAYLGQMIVDRLGNGQCYGLEILYSAENKGGLETAGGIRQALPLIGKAPFIVTNADIWTDYPYQQLSLQQGCLAHLVLVDNPAFHRQGDFSLADGHVRPGKDNDTLTFSGIAAYDPLLFANLPEGRLALAPVLHEAIRKEQVSGEYYAGDWHDIGTAERLAALHQRLDNSC